MAATAGATLALLALLPGHALARALAASWCVGVSVHAFAGVRRARQVRMDARRIQVDEVPGEVVEGSFVAPWLTVVRWRPLGARLTRTLLVLPDMLDAERFRRLRVVLRWEGKIRA